MPSEETGLAQYFLDNQSDYEITVVSTFSVASVTKNCDSCRITAQTKTLLGHDAAFGYAPKPAETIESIRIYRNDSLKATWVAPFADSVWVKQKGQDTYDWDFLLAVSNQIVQ